MTLKACEILAHDQMEVRIIGVTEHCLFQKYKGTGIDSGLDHSPGVPDPFFVFVSHS